MTALAVVRPDLSQRTALSKSALVGFELCQSKAWYEIHDRRPMLPNEKVSFGSALDAATEALVTGFREGWTADKALEAAADGVFFVQASDDIELPIDELNRATTGFWNEVMPEFRWGAAATQPDLWADIPGIGEVNGHPDIVLGDNSVWDVKSSSRAKAIPSVELGLYALLLEAAHGEPVHETGYLTWVRSGKGHWEIQRQPMTDELRRWTWESMRRFSVVKALDADLNSASPTPSNVVFAGGPKFPGLCGDCQYSPANGGPCQLVFQGGVK